ncbi:MAG: hypothetical protein HQM04_04725 [Magnetococcales bacterium]|nr:hypothetical protein [Magnetococcales bacterium]MBF0114329.1 hypothetical protein [Magnetococcales bacterium]
MRHLTATTFVLLTLATPPPAEAVEFLFSGYGTVSYALSDRPYAYQRSIDNHGTLLSDTTLGLQLDTRFSSNFSATLQGKVAPANDTEKQWDPKISWAFLSWQPANSWMLRAGKMRVPLYLNAENKDVGVTFDVARLPAEVYGIAPTSDFVGGSITKSWSREEGEWIVDAYWGQGNTDIRTYLRDGIPGTIAAGEHYAPVEIEARGLALTYHPKNNDTYRVGFHLATPKSANNTSWAYDVAEVPYNALLAPGVHYYTDSAPGIKRYNQVNMPILAFGTSLNLPEDYTLTAEYFHNWVQGEEALTVDGGYATLLKKIDKWSPYVTFAGLRSGSRLLKRYQTLNASSIPGLLPGATVINASQRALADAQTAFDQTSWTIGIAYAFSPVSKIKTEWTNVRVGEVPGFVDSPSGNGVSNQNVNLLTLSYSFAF